MTSTLFPLSTPPPPGGVRARSTPMSPLGSDFDEIRRETDARRLGAALYREAESISPEAVEYVAAAVADEYAKEMMAGAAEAAYERTVGM